MGVLNMTPDSFSDGGLFYKKKNAYAHAIEMIKNGAAIIDIGGELIINGTNNDLPWKVGIQNPASLSDNAIYIIENKLNLLQNRFV